MARRYEGTGTLPGMDDPVPDPPRTRERSRARATASATRATRQATWRIAALGFMSLVAVLAGAVVYHYIERFLIIDPRFALNGEDATAASASVEVAGASHVSPRAIEAVFAEDQGRSVYLIPISERRSTLRTVDWVRDASVARIWPNRLLVTVDERKPVAFVTLSGSKFGLIDEDGVILPPAQDRFTLPVATGIKASDPLTERRERVRRMLRVMGDLGDMGHDISEIDVADRDNIKVSQPYHGRELTLLLGDHNFNGRYRNFLNHYAEIQKRLPGATTLDLRLEDRITVVE